MKTEETKKSGGMDMTTGPLWGKVLLFTLPLACTGILQQLFNAADVAVVGQFTGSMGAHCMAAVGACASLISLTVNLFIGISLGSNVVIANAVGSGRQEHVQKAIVTSIWIALTGGILLMFVGETLAGALLEMMSVPDEVFPLADLYLSIYMLGMPVILLYNFEAAVFRGIGQPQIPLMALTAAGIINVLLNLLFVIGFGMTVDGVATATVASNVVSSLLLFVILLKQKRITWHMLFHGAFHKEIVGRILRIGVPAGIQSSVFSVANVVIQSGVNSLGTIVMAAGSASLNIEFVVYNLVNSFGQACTTFTGQNFGAGKIRRCRQVLKTCLLEGMLVTCVASGTVILLGKPLLAIFNPTPEVINNGYLRLVTLMCSYFFSIQYEVVSGYLRGFGISVLPAILTTLGVCVLRVFWILFIFPASPTYPTILAVFPLSLGTAAVLLIIALAIKRPAARLLTQS